MKNFRDLKVWEKSHRLALDVYKATRSFPREELFGLAGQTRRAAASVPANIAEGCGRGGNLEFKQFLQIAMGSASELEYHLLLAHELGLICPPDYTGLAQDVTEVKRMLSGLIRKLKADR